MSRACGCTIPVTHKVCGEDGEFCSDSCFAAETLWDIAQIYAKVDHEIGPLTAMYQIKNLVDRFDKKTYPIESFVDKVFEGYRNDIWNSWRTSSED